MSDLYRKYRPDTFDSVYGQKTAVTQLQKIVERRSAQVFLFQGPSGVGKTTLARIAAHGFGCTEATITEVPAAVFTGVEDMRKIQELTQYQPFGEVPHRAIIIDECQRLSSAAWDSILKCTEEPAKNTYWFFCTTNPDKVPKQMQTRCIKIKLREIDKETLTDLIEAVCDEEGIDLSPEVRQVVVRQAEGSARQALVNLELCRDIDDRKAAAEVLDTATDDDDDATRAICRLLATGNVTWPDLMKHVEKLNGTSAEGVRIQIILYMAKAARSAKTDKQAKHFLQLIEEFGQSYGTADGDAQLLRSLGHCVFG